MPLQTLPLIMAPPQKWCFDTHIFKISLPWEGDSLLPHPPPLGNFAPSLCPPPRLTNPGYTSVTGVAIRGHKGPGPPPPHWLERLNKTFNVQKKKSFWYANFQTSPYRGPTPFPHSVASLPRFGPLLQNSWLCQWSYCLCLLFTFPVIL